mgnify:CR=1 FL=1
MHNRKIEVRFFTIADYEEEEAWLHDRHSQGWKLVKMTPPCFYVFEKCAPADVTYRLDYKNNTQTSDYFQVFQDYGWEYVGSCVGWLYFRKPKSQLDSEFCQQRGNRRHTGNCAHRGSHPSDPAVSISDRLLRLKTAKTEG